MFSIQGRENPLSFGTEKYILLYIESVVLDGLHENER